jgi:hypothetical protein
VKPPNSGNFHVANALAPEAARHQDVRKRATFAFDSRRLHHRSLHSLGFGGVVRQTGFGRRPRLNRLDSRRLQNLCFQIFNRTLFVFRPPSPFSEESLYLFRPSEPKTANHFSARGVEGDQR